MNWPVLSIMASGVDTALSSANAEMAAYDSAWAALASACADAHFAAGGTGVNWARPRLAGPSAANQQSQVVALLRFEAQGEATRQREEASKRWYPTLCYMR